MDYDHVLDQLTRWAGQDGRIRALVLTGSGGANKAHALSDRDIEVYTTATDELLADEAWWSHLGELLVVERLENADGFPTRLAYYAGGKLDFTIIPAERLGGTTYDRPFQILLDKDGAAAAVHSTSLYWPPPESAEFEQSINWAYAAALMCAKALVRDELWAAKFRDVDLKEQLLQMIEWDHRARYGADFDTRYLGTRMYQWMDADIRESLDGCWGHFDKKDAAAALRQTVRLYASLATRTARVLGLRSFDHERLATEIDSILTMGHL